MDKLWAPWRMKYIRNKTKPGCIFCRAAKSKFDKRNYVLFRNDVALAMLNIFPYNNGHCMVSPIRHTRDFAKLGKNEILGLLGLLTQTLTSLKAVLKPEGFNIGINIGKVSGAGIAGHLHLHIVPRWKADTNFMPVISDTKIVSQSLDELYAQLKKYAAKP